ncbi:MAG: 3,4-dihydroxy-2-butanone-4-phosphate synthase [Desulfurococcales archaeon]|nr:3,4-dihydroxy-2-butanone-4-phosphate synthase [Desulfurococcales archaeon]
MDGIEKAIRALAEGTPVLVFDSDDREGEVDMVFHASHATPDRVYKLRTEAGGLICYATDWRIASGLGLTWGDTLIALHDPLRPLTLKRLGYGDRPAFTIWVNHIGVKTGISDEDRARTIRELDKTVSLYIENGPEEAREKFVSEFQAPGHVPLLAGRPLRERRGHTELSLALARLANLTPSVFFAEMLDYGKSMSVETATRLAEKNKWPIIDGFTIIEACRREEVCWRG